MKQNKKPRFRGKWMKAALAAALANRQRARIAYNPEWFDRQSAAEQEAICLKYWLTDCRPKLTTARYLPELRRMLGTRLGSAWETESTLRFLLTTDYRVQILHCNTSLAEARYQNDLIAYALRRALQNSPPAYLTTFNGGQRAALGGRSYVGDRPAFEDYGAE